MSAPRFICIGSTCACAEPDEPGTCACVAGVLVNAQGQHRCRRCNVLLERQCPECGCTDSAACSGGCCWVEGVDVCSACIPVAYEATP